MLAGWSLIGLAVMASLTIIEVVVIHALCSWCLLTAIASVLLAGGALAAWWNGRSTPGPVGRSARARRHAEDARGADDRSVRSFSLATAVDESQAKAQYRDGVLELTLPKQTTTSSKRLPIG